MINKLLLFLGLYSRETVDFDALKDELKRIRGLSINDRKETIAHITRLIAEVNRIDDKVAKLDDKQADMDGRLREVEAKIATGDFKRYRERTQDAILKFISGETTTLPRFRG